MSRAAGPARWHAAHALLPGGPARDVTFTAEDGRLTSVTPGTEPGAAVRLPGVVLPGLADAHSHAFHRALRGRTHDGGGTFWTWRERMYAVARRLDPDRYLALARATYAEMALAGVTCVGEFHYLHHTPDGTPYDDPNAMAEALRQAADDAGIRLTLLDTCYLAGGLTGSGHAPLDGAQLRYGDGDAERWAARVAELRPSEGMRAGVAAHSVRAVPRAALATVAAAAAGRPLHVHLSEQPAENEACAAFYGVTPTRLLEEEGVLGPATSVVHATHLTEQDVAVLGRTRTTACFCPTTERDLADGIGPARALWDAGAPLSLGSDQHAVIDLLEEARALETHERLRSLRRGRFQPRELLAAATAHGSLGWPDAGRLEPGARADLVAVRLDTPRTAGVAPEQVLLAATAADIDTVVVDGRTVVTGGRHVLGDVAALLAAAIDPLWEDA
ncbi:formimidoylglutamate deiminase [Microtetraspora niveoalba]|uniref:formimidoylglutamate deiminase n=1 Tax=Microtetraspora niveoalba TaxID=46175 RepID=UPI000835BFAF|nr:formimidoylglutamate deiminase [Microtetraspora niveoalba]